MPTLIVRGDAYGPLGLRSLISRTKNYTIHLDVLYTAKMAALHTAILAALRMILRKSCILAQNARSRPTIAITDPDEDK